jgi:uncharacterized membrane protein YkvA (DUF1232 family)
VSTGAEFSTTTSRRGRRSRLRAQADESTDGTPEAPRTGAKRTVMSTIRQLPAYVKLLFGLLTDGRVSTVDKLLVAGAAAYILMPVDLIPDVIPFLGQVDDVFLLMTSLQRLITNAGRQVVIDHWTGDMEELADLNLKRVVSAASFFLPLGMRRKLRRIGSS